MTHLVLKPEDIFKMKPDDFSGKDFSGTDFSNLCLVGANFSNSICKDCDFSGCDLSQACFRNADLYRCRFNNSILYAVELDGANLTRADFSEAYMYGLLIHGFVNITYAKMLDFRLEKRRRKVTITNDHIGLKFIPFGSKIESVENLCLSSYQVNQYRFTFTELDPQEAAMQKSQIYNKLKRTYKDNEYGEEALYCWYYEHYYLTRSFYKYNPLTGSAYKDFLFQSLLKTLLSFCNEVLSGYGLRPSIIFRNMIFLLILFTLISMIVSMSSNTSGVIYEQSLSLSAPITQTKEVKYIDLGKQDNNAMEFAYYSIITVASFESEAFAPYGIMIPISVSYTLSCLVLMALLLSSLFLKVVSD